MESNTGNREGLTSDFSEWSAVSCEGPGTSGGAALLSYVSPPQYDDFHHRDAEVTEKSFGSLKKPAKRAAR
jgi:hypothetical protein